MEEEPIKQEEPTTAPEPLATPPKAEEPTVVSPILPAAASPIRTASPFALPRIDKKIIIAVASLVFAFCLVAALAFLNPVGRAQASAVFPMATPVVAALAIPPTAIVQTANAEDPVLKSIAASEAKANQTRLNYGKYVPTIVFDKLPPFPKDFYTFKNLVWTGKIDVSQVGEQYWKQPEFYPNWDIGLQNREQRYTDPLFWDFAKGESKRFGAWGYGAYPASRGIRLSKGQSRTVTVLWYSGWTVETVQGMSMAASLPNQTEAVLPTGKEFLEQNPEDAAKSVAVEFSPKNVAIYPAFPQFSKEWVVSVSVTVTALPDAVVGKYFAVIHPDSPEKEFSDELFAKWTNNYVPVSGSVGVSPAMQVIVVEVVE